MWLSRSVQYPCPHQGTHKVTEEVLAAVPEITSIKVGLLHLFCPHTSASISINEEYDPDIRRDLDDHMRHLVPDDMPYWRHTLEGGDDISGHIKTALLDTSLSIPIRDGKLLLGPWQGIFLSEHKAHPRTRTIILTLQGE